MFLSRTMHRCFSSTSLPVASSAVTKVVCIGLGNMGYPLAGRIADAGFPTSVYDLDQDAVKRHNVEHHTAPCLPESLLPTICDADVLVTCLPNSSLVREVQSTLRGNHKPNSIWIDATSGDPEETSILAKDLLQSENVHFIDCAVSGGPTGCSRGALTSMLGGSEEAFKRPPGSGHAVKAINNTLLAINIWASGEAIVSLKKRGVDPHAAINAINTSSGRNWGTLQRFPDNILTGKYDYGFSLGLHAKDVRTAMRMLGDTNAPMLATADKLLHLAKSELGPEADHTEVVKIIEKWMDTKLLEDDSDISSQSYV